MIDCAHPHAVTVIEAPAEGLAEAALDALLAPLQPLREQFTAITGIGLDSEVPAGAPPGRWRLDASGVSYLVAGQPDGRRVLFIHGSPGRAEEWGTFLGDVPPAQYRLAVDRPGFGESPLVAAPLALAAQAAAVAPLLGPGTVLVGYSYGGPVALRLAVDWPDQVAGVVLVGSAADPAREVTHPLQALAATNFIAQILPTELAHSNAELMALKPELELLAGDLGRINASVTIVQGLRDTLVPPENASFIATHIDPAVPVRVVLIEDGDHFLPWTHPEILEAAIGCALADAGDQGPPSELPSGPASEPEER